MPTEDDVAAALRPSATIDSGHPAVVAFAQEVAGKIAGDRERAVALHDAVRDRFRYDAYKLDLSVAGLSGSGVLANGYGWCVPKAALLAASCRALGVPARIGLADVRNHLSTARLRGWMGTDVFYCHGYTAILLDGRWLKATPAFNVELCRKMRLRTLEFDATADSIYHPFDLEGKRHMEYLRFRGEYDDIPREELLRVFAEHYPRLGRLDGASWSQDVDAEASKEDHHG